MNTPWPTLSLKKKPTTESPETTPETPAQPTATAVDSTPPGSTIENTPSPPQNGGTPPAKVLSKHALRRKRKKARLRDQWYFRLREGDLCHLAPVLVTDLPLMIGAQTELERRLERYLAEQNPDVLPQVKKIVIACLEHHTHQEVYLQACARQEKRHDLDGQAVEAMDKKGLRYSQRMLKKMARESQATEP